MRSVHRDRWTVHYLLIRSRNGDCGFPKGHVEKGESEIETALRETFEETSIKVEIIHVFRYEMSCAMRNGKEKTLVYYLATYSDQKLVHNLGFEDNEYLVLPYKEAYDKLSFENTKLLLKEANGYLLKNNFIKVFEENQRKNINEQLEEI